MLRIPVSAALLQIRVGMRINVRIEPLLRTSEATEVFLNRDLQGRRGAVDADFARGDPVAKPIG